jgi:hypothetical protein
MPFAISFIFEVAGLGKGSFITRRNIEFFHYHPLQLLVQFDHYLIYYHHAQISNEIVY